MTDPYGQQPFGQQQPGGQQPFGQPGPTPYGGQPAPFGQPAPYGQGAPFGAPRNYATWGQRALGWLVDFGPIFVLYAIFGLLYAVIHNVGSLIIIVGVLAWLGWIAWTIYNRWIQQGNTGQSMGKRIAKIKLVREDNGQPVGAGMAFVRDLAHFVDNVICYVGWLWPLWDDKAQTLADKIVGTVVVQADDAAAPTQFGQPGAQQFAGGYPPPSGGFEQQAPGGFGQPQPGGVAQPPQAGGFPQSGGFDQPQSGGFPQQPQPGGLDQPQAGGFPQQPQPGGFDQPQPGGFPQQPPQSGGFPQQPAPGGFGQPQPPSGGFPAPGQPLAPPPGGPAFDEQAERTQMLRPDTGGASAFDEQAERTQMLRPENQDEAEQTRKIDPGQFGQH